MNSLIYNSLVALKNKNIPNPELDLRILLQNASFKKKDIIISNLNINEIDIKYFKLLIKKRLNNEPISKILNNKYFWKNNFFVNEHVLDPRPETELIIEEVLNNIRDKNKKLNILDIGTGSGCIAISLALELINSHITAIDISKKALEVAKRNVVLNSLENRIELKLEKLENITKKFDIIVSNPPYLSENQYSDLQLEIKNYEPKIALVADKNGLKFFELFAKKLDKIMNNKSIFICEIGYNQLNSCMNIFNNTNLKLQKISKDINKIDRTLTFLKI